MRMEEADLDDLLEFALGKGAKKAILQRHDSRTKQVRFNKGTISAAKSWRRSVLSIFVSVEGKTLSTSLTDESRIKDAITAMVENASFIPENPHFKGVYSGKGAAGSLERCDASPSELLDMADALMQGAKDGGANHSSGAILSKSSKRTLVSSQGVTARETFSSVDTSIRAFWKGGGSGHAVESHARKEELDPYGTGKKAADWAEKAEGARQGKEGVFTVLFTPMFFADFLDKVGTFASAYYYNSGMSPLSEKMGKPVASEKITISDDGKCDAGVNSHLFDDEGHPTQSTKLIDKGVFRNALHNTSTADILDVPSTGNAGLTVPRPWNTVMEPGDMDFTEMMSEMKKGLILTNTWYTRFQNRVKGDFSTMPRDAVLYVENGEVAESWKGVRLKGNLLDILMNVKHVGNEREQIHWWQSTHPNFSSPAMVSNVRITVATQ